MKALYGFSPDFEPFQQKNAEEQVALLKSWGVDAIFGGYDDPAFVEAIHAAGMRIYAEFGCFRGQEWWERFPESRPITASGEPMEPEEWYHGVNPTVPQVRTQLLDDLGALLRDHRIDGVWLDFIRWPCRWEKTEPKLIQTSFDDATLARFREASGLEVHTAQEILTRHQDAWTAWKCQQIESWVAEARALVDELRPEIILGLFGIPWRRDDHGGAILKLIGQDFAALAQYIDVFSPMTYHLMCSQPPAWIGQVADEVKTLTGKPVYPIIQSVDHPSPLSLEDYAAALKAAAAFDGTIVFTLAGVLDGDRLGPTIAQFIQS
jgi:hypothetical protein